MEANPMRTSGMVAIFLLAAAATSLLPAAGEARPSKRANSVTVCSQYGNGCVTGAIRPGQWGSEVRLPGGTWISCKLDCKQTLREESVDFFETLRERAPDNRR
jgi:hypothetical protein